MKTRRSERHHDSRFESYVKLSWKAVTAAKKRHICSWCFSKNTGNLTATDACSDRKKMDHELEKASDMLRFTSLSDYPPPPPDRLENTPAFLTSFYN